MTVIESGAAVACAFGSALYASLHSYHNGLIMDDPIYYWREKAGNRDAGASAAANLIYFFGRQFMSSHTA